jgi:hypothetical protein
VRTRRRALVGAVALTGARAGIKAQENVGGYFREGAAGRRASTMIDEALDHVCDRLPARLPARPRGAARHCAGMCELRDPARSPGPVKCADDGNEGAGGTGQRA